MIMGSSSLQQSNSTVNELINYDAFCYEDEPLFTYPLDGSQPFLDQNFYTNFPQIENENLASNSTPNKGESPEYCEMTSDASLNFISRMLLEEDIEEKFNTFQEGAALRATEKPFYELLGQEYPPSPSGPPPYINQTLNNQTVNTQTINSPDDSSNSSYTHSISNNTSNSSGTDTVDHFRPQDFDPALIDESSQTQFTSPDKFDNVLESFNKTLISTGFLPDLSVQDLPAWQFKKGEEEAKKFLPSIDNLVIDLEAHGLSTNKELKKESRSVFMKLEEEGEEERENTKYNNRSRGRKNPHGEDFGFQEERSSKQSAVYSDEPAKDETFDKVLLCHGERCADEIAKLREIMENEANKTSSKDSHMSKGKVRGKRQNKKDLVDLRTLLIHCAQTIATDDRRTANELLKKIRQHASPDGDGPQRLSNVFADGLEARLAGTGSQIYHRLVSKRTTAVDYLKAYRLYLTACPFKRATYFFSNQTILNVTENAPKLHIIDFGINFGFQWPSLIQRLANRKGAPPKLRITGIEVPQPGFRPTEQVEETGRRLKEYAREFSVPFEYQHLATKWENIRVEDLKLRRDEVVIVNCLYRFRNLVDETVAMDSPRDRVLKTIRRINPCVFIHAVVNGSYSAPFFVTRFREVLFHFSALFDMLDTTVPRGNEQRALIERGIFGRDALNVIACEGSERVERPETYRQWQVRTLRAGFEQLPVDPAIMNRIKDKVRDSYHPDFVIDEDCRWLLQGWKGRIVYAMSTWQPNTFSLVS